ncbi:type III secretion system outer membrane ring subunit SctC [Roseateles sp. YR242]|uniref:type III secretion system outer membrane ring subunit SctC n=1 Tax=Roseateles sp. YR242 TaxID=1855305 RepID=UPI001160BDD8|nr:type III secretion system outer membrane ring subunit SctC [Roseateles sp. YR242]
MSAWHLPAQATTPPGWQDIRYSNRADDQATLESVLRQFSSTMGVELRLADPKLGQRRMLVLPERGSAPAAFLDQLTQSLSMDWYVYRGILYVSAQSASVSDRVVLNGQTAAAARQALVGLGLFESRFGWGELDTDPPMVLLSGPASYVNAVKAALEVPKKEAETVERPKLMVFRLKHATAQDREVQVRGITTRQPGLASTLKQLIAPASGQREDPGGVPGANLGSSMGSMTGALSNSWPGSLSAPGVGVTDPGMGAATPLSSLAALGGLGGRDFLSSPLPEGLLTPSARKSGDRTGGEGAKLSAELARLPAIAAYPPLNAVLVWDLPSRRPEYDSLIDELDVATRQVEINVTILDVNVNALREWAVDLSAGSGAARVQVNAAGNIAGDGSSSVAGGSSMVLWATDRLSLRLRSLESRGQAQVMSRPSLLTQDNHPAVLDMSQSVYVKLVGERTADLRTVSAGTMLRVTPSVMGSGNDATIRVTLDIEDGALADNAADSSAPLVGNSSVSTQAVVRPGESLVVGGYRRQNTESSHSRVPGLDSVPLLGWLFRGESVISDERERLFIVTARVLP